MLDGDELHLEQHLPRMYRVALRIVGSADEAEDVVQEACERALRHCRSFEGRSQITTWLYRMTTNAAVDQLRKRNRARRSQSFCESDLEGMLLCLNESPERSVEQRELYEIARLCVEALPDDCRMAFVLTQMDGYTYDEAASIEGLPRGTVASRVYRAKKLLLAAMTAKNLCE